MVPKLQSTQHYFCKSLLGAIQTRVVWAGLGNSLNKSSIIFFPTRVLLILPNFFSLLSKTPLLYSTLFSILSPSAKCVLLLLVLTETLFSPKNMTFLFCSEGTVPPLQGRLPNPSTSGYKGLYILTCHPSAMKALCGLNFFSFNSNVTIISDDLHVHVHLSPNFKVARSQICRSSPPLHLP